MAALKDKLDLIDYLITQILNWRKEIDEREYDESKVLNYLGCVPLMKMQYIISLLTVRNYSEASQDDKIGLFKYFDSYYAYPKGPVEVDCYYNMSKLSNYSLDDKGFVRNETSSNNAPLVIPEPLVIRIKSSFDKLSSCKGFDFWNKEFLIDLTHRTWLWRDVYTPDDYIQMNTKTEDNLIDDALRLRRILDNELS